MSDAPEEWRPIPGWEGRYEVSDLGRVRSLMSHHRRPYPTPRIKAQMLIGDRLKSYAVRMTQPGQNRLLTVHRLVLLAFVGPAPTPLHEGAHRNGDHLDNRLVNLSWLTKAENEADRVTHGTVLKGERHPMAKLTAAQVEEMRAYRAATGDSYAKIGLRFGVNADTAHRAITGRTWSKAS